MADNFEMRELFDDIAVAGKQDPDVCPAPERPRQRRRDGSKAADPNEVIHLRGNEQDSQETPSHAAVANVFYARSVPIVRPPFAWATVASVPCTGGHGGNQAFPPARAPLVCRRSGGPKGEFLNDHIGN